MVNEKDIQTLNVIETFELIDSRNLARYLNTSENSARNRLNKLHKKKWLNRYKILTHLQTCYSLTRKGKTIIGVNSTVYRPKLGTILHEYLVMRHGIGLICKNKLRLEQLKTDHQLRQVGQMGHKPDILIKTKKQYVAIEVELTQKENQRLMRNIEINDENYDTQIWYCMPHIADLIEKSKDSMLLKHQLITFKLKPEVISYE